MASSIDAYIVGKRSAATNFNDAGDFLTTEKGFWKNKSMAIKRTISSWNTRG
jgi:hypothetical protein